MRGWDFPLDVERLDFLKSFLILVSGVFGQKYEKTVAPMFFASRFGPCCWRPRKESKPTYKAVFNAAKECARACLDLDLALRIAQCNSECAKMLFALDGCRLRHRR